LKTFLFGGGAGIATMVGQALNAKPVGLSCVGSLYPGYGNVDVMSSDEILSTINDSRADFLAVALSAAKGQAWLHRNRERLRVPIRAQLGAAINFQAGTLKRAPERVQKLGLEWLWRIKEEPQLWRRYAYDGMSLVKLLFAQVLPVAMIGWRQRLMAKGDQALRVERSQDGGNVSLKFSGCATAAHADVAASWLRQSLAAQTTVCL
jgi:N-acetylglucosaminyldiphosphoundecaprenol N-acetyl-beta-D-mannosaminyltransferase